MYQFGEVVQVFPKLADNRLVRSTQDLSPIDAGGGGISGLLDEIPHVRVPLERFLEFAVGRAFESVLGLLLHAIYGGVEDVLERPHDVPECVEEKPDDVG